MRRNGCPTCRTIRVKVRKVLKKLVPTRSAKNPSADPIVTGSKKVKKD
jgi:hypothetical protein